MHQSPQSFDSQMQKYNLVDINMLDDKIVVNLRYSTSDNFVGVDMYGDFDRAYFVRDFADRVVKAQRILQAKHPEYTLLIYDAARPISVQCAMRKAVEGTADALVDLQAKTVTVTGNADPAALKKAITDAGYEVIG